MKLKLEVNNTDDDIQNHKLEQLPGYYRCNSCGHKWSATLADMLDNPHCRNKKCKK